MKKQPSIQFVRQEVVDMPYKPPKKTFWQYQFDVPNTGNDGLDYYTRYLLSVDIPPLSDFELEKNNMKIHVEPMVTINIIQGTMRFKSRIKYLRFITSPLVLMLSDKSGEGLRKAIEDVQESIIEIRKDYTNIYGTYYSNGTVYKESE